MNPREISLAIVYRDKEVRLNRRGRGNVFRTFIPREWMFDGTKEKEVAPDLPEYHGKTYTVEFFVLLFSLNVRPSRNGKILLFKFNFELQI